METQSDRRIDRELRMNALTFASNRYKFVDATQVIADAQIFYEFLKGQQESKLTNPEEVFD